MLPEMSDKDANIENIAERALEDEELLCKLFEGLRTKEETLRYNCFKALMLISEKHGEVLYPKWDYLAGLLSSDNTYWKLSGLQLIANLTKVDRENKFEQIFDKYYELIDDKSMIVATYVAKNSWKIVNAKPQLETRITNKLLSIDGTHHALGRKDLVKAGAIEAFSQYFEGAKDKDKITEFVKQQLTSGSPKTRKIAKEFLQSGKNKIRH